VQDQGQTGGYIVIQKARDGMFYLDVDRDEKKLVMNTAEKTNDKLHLIPDDED